MNRPGSFYLPPFSIQPLLGRVQFPVPPSLPLSHQKKKIMTTELSPVNFGQSDLSSFGLLFFYAPDDGHTSNKVLNHPPPHEEQLFLILKLIGITCHVLFFFKFVHKLFR